MKRILFLIWTFTLVAGVTTSGAPEEKDDNVLYQDPIFTVCLPKMLKEYKAEGSEYPIQTAQLVCEMAANTCINNPSSEYCENMLRKFAVGPNDSGPSTLFSAAKAGRTELIRTMLEMGTDPNVAETEYRWTPLMIAAAEGQQSTVSLLLEAGAHTNVTNLLGRTALMFASSYGYDAIVQDLLKHQADPNLASSDEFERTPLMSAAIDGHTKTIRILLDSGADASLTDKLGRTALALAEGEGHRKAARLLKKAGRRG